MRSADLEIQEAFQKEVEQLDDEFLLTQYSDEEEREGDAEEDEEEPQVTKVLCHDRQTDFFVVKFD